MFGAFAARAARPLACAGLVNAAAPKKEPSCKGNNATVDGASTTILLSPIAGGG